MKLRSNVSPLRKCLNGFQRGLFQELGSLIEKTLASATLRGADFSEYYFEENISTRIIYESGKVDRIIDGVDRGVGFRLIKKGRTVYGYTTIISKESLEKLSHLLLQSLEPTTSDRTEQYYPPKGKWKDQWIELKNKKSSKLQKKITSPASLKLKDKIEFLKKAESSAKGVLTTYQQISCFYQDIEKKTLIINSFGSIARDFKTYVQLAVEVVASKDGKVESGYETDGGSLGVEFFIGRIPEDIGKEAARRAQVLLSAVPAPSGSMPVIISAQAGGTMIHEAVGHGLEADIACNGLSVYHGKLGQIVASPKISVIDDGTILKLRGSFMIDDEGQPSQKNLLIENGVLKSYLVDRLSAMKFDLMATGNGRRESFRHIPIVRMTNTYIAPGKDDPNSILRDTNYGIFVNAVGGGEVNPLTGDFVFAVTEGYLIRKGKLGSPIRGATLVGNGPKVLTLIDRVGTDLYFSTGTCGKDGQSAPVTDAQPTIRIPELTVGGETPKEKYFT